MMNDLRRLRPKGEQRERIVAFLRRLIKEREQGWNHLIVVTYFIPSEADPEIGSYDTRCGYFSYVDAQERTICIDHRLTIPLRYVYDIRLVECASYKG